MKERRDVSAQLAQKQKDLKVAESKIKGLSEEITSWKTKNSAKEGEIRDLKTKLDRASVEKAADSEGRTKIQAEYKKQIGDLENKLGDSARSERHLQYQVEELEKDKEIWEKDSLRIEAGLKAQIEEKDLQIATFQQQVEQLKSQNTAEAQAQIPTNPTTIRYLHRRTSRIKRKNQKQRS